MHVKRILMTGDTRGGVWTFTLDLARSLCAKGIEVLLAAFGGAVSDEQHQQALAIAGLRLFTFDLRLEWMDNAWRDIEQSARILSQLEREFAPDVIHLNSYGHGNVAWRAPAVLTAHSCGASWWAAVRNEPLPDSWNEYRVAVEQSIRAAAAVTAPSKVMLESLSRHYGAMPGRSLVIANGCRWKGGSPRSKQPFIFSAGRLWDEARNLSALARVANQLTWPVYLAGAARDPKGNEIAFEGCRMLGTLSSLRIANWLSRASIYAAPAKYEPFGLAVLEAGLAGCALVLADIPSLRETWQDAALFVTDAGLEQAITRLIADQRLRQEYAARARARAREFTAAKTAAAYLHLYQSVTERSLACAS